MRHDRRLTVGFLGFLLLGMPYAALGVAWPSMAGDLSRPLGELGVMLVATTIGYVLATAANGLVTNQFGPGKVLPFASAVATGGIALWASASHLAGLLVGALVVGAAGGSLDAGVNSHVAVHGSTRTMSLLHATFGLGSALGPLLTTVVIGQGASWRVAFWVLAGAQLVVTLVFAVTAQDWPQPARAVTARGQLKPGAVRILALGLIVFAIYTGVEVSAGEWSFSFLTEGRSFGIESAGYLVAGYWGALTVGRLAMGFVGHRLTHGQLLIGSIAGALAGGLLLWLAPHGVASAAGLLVLGLFLAPIFPVLILMTAHTLGEDAAPAAVGYQIAAAGVGAALIPGGIGILVGSRGVAITAPVIAGALMLLLVLAVGFGISAGRSTPTSVVPASLRSGR